MKESFVVIGMDVSTKTGLVVLNESGRVMDQREFELPALTVGAGPGPRVQRALNFKTNLHAYIRRWGSPRLVAIEGYKTMGKFVNYVQNELGATARLGVMEARAPFIEVSPTTVKKFATGSGKGDKSQVRLGVFKRWAFEHDSDNVVDAYVLARIALAACGVGSLKGYELEVIGTFKKAMPGGLAR